MKQKIYVYCGEGKGKTSAALGLAVRAVCEGKTVYFIRFMKNRIESDVLKRLEPELKIFRFERLPVAFDDMSEEERSEEKKNIQNGINFAHKALVTGECDMLVLDEVLGAVSEGVLEETVLLEALSKRGSETSVILTGRNVSQGIVEVADYVYNIQSEKVTIQQREALAAERLPSTKK